MSCAKSFCLRILSNTKFGGFRGAHVGSFVLDEAARGVLQASLSQHRLKTWRLPPGFGQIQTANLIGWEGDSAHPEFQQFLDAVRAYVGEEKPSGLISIELSWEILKALDGRHD